MGKRCGVCKYERQPNDQIPENECPRCGRLYVRAEFERMQSAQNAPDPSQPQPAPEDHLVEILLNQAIETANLHEVNRLPLIFGCVSFVLSWIVAAIAIANSSSVSISDAAGKGLVPAIVAGIIFGKLVAKLPFVASRRATTAQVFATLVQDRLTSVSLGVRAALTSACLRLLSESKTHRELQRDFLKALVPMLSACGDFTEYGASSTFSTLKEQYAGDQSPSAQESRWTSMVNFFRKRRVLGYITLGIVAIPVLALLGNYYQMVKREKMEDNFRGQLAQLAGVNPGLPARGAKIRGKAVLISKQGTTLQLHDLHFGLAWWMRAETPDEVETIGMITAVGQTLGGYTVGTGVSEGFDVGNPLPYKPSEFGEARRIKLTVTLIERQTGNLLAERVFMYEPPKRLEWSHKEGESSYSMGKQLYDEHGQPVRAAEDILYEQVRGWLRSLPRTQAAE